jgi:hypothetical protein
MEDQIPSSTPPQSNQPIPGQITPEMLAQMKQQAMELALAQQIQQQQEKRVYQINEPVPESMVPAAQSQFGQQTKPQIVYVRRNLTVAELLVMLILSIGIVTGFQFGWKIVTDNIPKIEIRVK